MTDNELIEIARQYRENAYTPYSHFKVGAAVLTASGKVYGGCNIENSSYGLTICAERTAAVKAVSEGHTKFKRIVIAGRSDDYCYPCGACRQFLAEFAPENASQDCSYLMFVAHYDSRYSQPMPRRDTVWSYGAADDGYGLGVTLETVSNLVKERSGWSQGVKILFTDAEEPGLNGMTAIWENNHEVFDNVGLMINIEARGPWGPALLFETCPGNSKVMELYARNAKSPFTYSLTTVVYSFMPNFTDFTIAKDHIPGLNFSTITDVNHYHTDLDNFSNVSAKTVQHYGAQILPVARDYVNNPKYADKDCLRSDANTVNFTIPVIGLINMSKPVYIVLNLVIFALFILLLVLAVKKNGVRLSKVFGTAGLTLFIGIVVLALGEGAAWLCAKIAGARFVPFGVTQGIMFDNAAMIVLLLVMTDIQLSQKSDPIPKCKEDSSL